jgi:hypothetical protein
MRTNLVSGVAVLGYPVGTHHYERGVRHSREMGGANARTDGVDIVVLEEGPDHGVADHYRVNVEGLQLESC